MGPLTRPIVAAVLGLAAAFLIAACGSSSSQKGYLSAAESETISAQAQAVGSAVDAGSCARARSAADRLSESLSKLPASVSQTLVRNLSQGASTIKQLSATDCTKNETTTTQTSTETPTTVTSTTTVPPPTSSTPTTPTQSTTTTPPPTTPTGPSTTPQTSTGGNGGGGGFQGGQGNGIHSITGGG